MVKFNILIALYLPLVVVQALEYGIDVSKNVFTKDNYLCLKSNSFKFVIANAFTGDGKVNNNARSNIQNAQNALMDHVAISFEPCRSLDVRYQIDQLITGIVGLTFSKVWVIVDKNPNTGCSWSQKSTKENCDYLEDIVIEFKSLNLNVGVYTNVDEWTQIMGSKDACPDAAKNVDLWYYYYNNSPTADDFKPIGGWTYPELKQYSQTSSICGISTNFDSRVV